MATAGDKIVIGSGKLYTMEFTGNIPADNVIETEENRLGYIQGGAQVVYKPKFVDIKDDLGYVSKTMLTDETVNVKSGVLTWNGKKLQLMCATARVEESNGKRTVKIGGLNNQDGKQYVIRFVHEDKADGDIRVTIVGNNQAGFTIKFTKDKETVIDAEFAAAPMDNEGTLIIYQEEIPQTNASSVPVTGITLDKTAASPIVGGTSKVTATVAPSNATNATLKWTSDDATIATVDQTGLITGIKAGTTTVTVVTTDGSNISQTVNITVTN